MDYAFPYQILLEIFSKQKFGSYSNFFREIIRKKDIVDIDKYFYFLEQELQNTSFQSTDELAYFFAISKLSLASNIIYQKDVGFEKAKEIISHRLQALKHVQHSDTDTVSWELYLDLLTQSLLRLNRNISIEEFEAYIDKLDWSAFTSDFIPLVSHNIGYVYLNEKSSDQKVKSRLWLSKAIRESDPVQNMENQYHLAQFYLSNYSPESAEQVQEIKHNISETSSRLEPDTRFITEYMLFDLELQEKWITFQPQPGEVKQFERALEELNSISLRFQQGDFKNAMPEYVKARLYAMISRLQAAICQLTEDTLDQETFALQANRNIQQAIDISESINDQDAKTFYKRERINILVETGQVVAEKDAKEVIQFFKKSNNYPAYIEANRAYLNLLKTHEGKAKTFDVITDIFKAGSKKWEEGGFYLITEGFHLSNEVFLRETLEPGISFMVHILDKFFDQIKEIMAEMEEHFSQIGPSLFESFRKAYINFAPVSHFNIKVYFQYQLYTLKLLRYTTLENEDHSGILLTDYLLNELEDEKNPMHVISADWDEFKNVPNFVRNNTLNKCITISKGDLPLAAEHLDFSYRNLRSYITFKEVNRLGFFLDNLQTDNRQLEQGIRYMFYDLYKKGTIFEVVFDMPKFLVEYATSGFYSQDLEQALNIKGTTAKKYIKIMIEIGLIRQDKTTGRKHYYRLIRDHVMKRLGRDQNTMI